jgi:hypothetical protein
MGSLRRSQAKTLVACMGGLMRDGPRGVAAIGRGMCSRVAPKHRIKRVDRWLSNPRLDRDAASADLIRLILMGRRVVRVMRDGTDAHDGHQTMVAARVTGHRRALPVATETVAKVELGLRQNSLEVAFIQRVRRRLPADCLAMLLADRGFCRVACLAAGAAADWRYVIRLTGDHWVDTPDDTGILQDLPARRVRWGDWAMAAMTKARFRARLIPTWAEGQAEPWFLVTNLQHFATSQVIREDARRFHIEECVKDRKNSHRGGFRLRGGRLTWADRWNRLWVTLMWDYAWLTWLGRWAEDTGWAQRLRANTVRERTHACGKVGWYVWREGHPPLEALWRWQPQLLLLTVESLTV